jgi:heme/copper-type cytochrome/quinol oxidase subunit 3
MATVAHADHGLDLPTRITRARVGVFLLILSDAGFVMAMYASQTYLAILNMNGSFRLPNEIPSIGTGFLLGLLPLVSAAVYGWGWLRLRAGSLSQYRTAVIVAWVIVLVALVAQVIALFSLRYATPIHGYASMVTVLTAYHGVHLLVTALIGFLLIGRATRGRIAGHEYVAEVCGYWWFYVALSALSTWLIMSYVR